MPSLITIHENDCFWEAIHIALLSEVIVDAFKRSLILARTAKKLETSPPQNHVALIGKIEKEKRMGPNHTLFMKGQKGQESHVLWVVRNYGRDKAKGDVTQDHKKEGHVVLNSILYF